jgi:hypothetical protein
LTDDEFAVRRSPRLAFLPGWLRRRPRDSVAAVAAGLAAITILINALFMQKGPHPAPIFAVGPAAPNLDPIAALLARQAAGDARVEAAAGARPLSDMVADIQRELARRGFYDGALDGVYGPKTDAAIRDFEAAAQLRPSAEPNDVLLATIRRSNVKAQAAPVKRLVAIQRALADFGYGPLKPTGVHDAETKAAIERFERARRQPATGRVSEQLVHDLAALTGRPLD